MSSFSGKFVLRIPAGLHRKIARDASALGKSLNQFILEKLMESPADSRVDLIQGTYKKDLVGVVLFGSKARGDHTETSDEDLLIVLKSEVSLNRDIYDRWDKFIEPRFPKVSPQFVNYPRDIKNVGGIWFEAALEGKVLFENGQIVTRLLSQLKQLIITGHYKRKWSHGHPYWVRG